MTATLRFCCLILLLCSTALAAGPTASPPRMRYNFNPGWRLMVGDPKGAESPSFDDSSWKPVTLPHAWNEDDAFAKPIHDLRTGVAWYRKHFTLPDSAAGQRVLIEFEGIRQGGEFYVNGKSVGRSDNGVMAFGFDITDAVHAPGEDNVIAARIDNSWNYREESTGSTFEWNDRNFYANYGGINKNVYLHVVPQLHQTLPLFSSLGTTGVYVYATDFGADMRSATIHAESQITNRDSVERTFTYQVRLYNPDGGAIITFDGGRHTLAAGQTTTVQASQRLGEIHFWSWGYGSLYNIETSLIDDQSQVLDSVMTRTGFRKTEFSHGSLKLNDRTIQIHGYAQRTTNEWPAIGLSVPAWVSDFSNGLMVDGNANLVRWMHVTPWKQDIESCDRVGLMEAMPAGDSERDVEGRRWEQRVEVMRDAIIYNRNNPSIIFYECGNKGVSEAHMAEMKALRDKYDPHGGRAIGAREMLDSKTSEYGGEMLYINKSAAKPLWAMEYCRDEALRKYWDEFSPPFHKVPQSNLYRKPSKGQEQWDLPPAYEYNRNQDSFAVEDVARWYDYWHERPGTGARVNAGGVNIIFSDSNTHYRGVQNYRRSGEVDAVRLPKDAYFADQAMWDGWVNPEHPRLHIVGHWNYAPGTVKSVYVVSNAERVELLLNGRSLGSGEQSNRFLFSFKNVAWQSGALTAVGYDAGGNETCRQTLQTAGAPAALRLTRVVSPHPLRADAADLALVDVEVVDAEGHRCPTALDMIHFSLEGPGEWRGGIAQADDRPDNFILSRDLPVQCGVNRVLIRSTTEPGNIVLTASAGGLAPASIQITSEPFAVAGGLSTQFPADGLPLHQSRGPTPVGDSVAITRTPLTITRVTAGSNADKAKLTFDDDEVTSWSSDGKLSNAWIQYELAKPASVSEITLKLGSWRTRSYPLRVMVDGHEAFAGSTPTSLGYVTLMLKPTIGRAVRIELTGPPKTERTLELSEVGNQSIDQEKTSSKGTLNIVEAELYEPLSPQSR